jgi:hypothetical protein
MSIMHRFTFSLFLIHAFIFLMTGNINAQVLCINCYDQNPPISTNINNLVVNGSFEISTCTPTNFDSFCPYSIYYSCDINNWHCSGGGPDTYCHLADSNFTVVPDGQIACYLGNLFANTCSPVFGDVSCLNFTGCTVQGISSPYPTSDSTHGGYDGVSISQTISGLTAGNVYVLEFWAGGEYYQLFTQPGIFAVDIGFGKIFLECPVTEAVTGTGKRYVIQFIAISALSNIKFTNWGHCDMTRSEVILDDIRVYPVSELSSIVPNCAVGIENSFVDNDIKVFQDGSHDHIKVISESDLPKTICIYNNLSQKVIEEHFTTSSQINVSALPKGTYYFEVKSKSSVLKNSSIVIM